MRFAVFTVSLLTVLVLLHLSQAVLVPLLLAALLAQLLVPVVSRLERRIPKSLAILASLSLVGLVLSVIVTILSEQIGAFQKTAPDLQQRFAGLLASTQQLAASRLGIEPSKQIELVKTGVESMLGAGGQFAMTALTATVGMLSTGFLVTIFAYLMLYYRRHFRKHVVAMMPSHPTEGKASLVDSVIEMGQKYVAGLLTVIGIVGVLDTIGMFAVGAPYPALFGLLGGLSVLIPYVGIIVVAPLCTLLAWMATGKALAALAVLLVFAVIHMAEGNVITPYLVGHQVNLNPLTSILAVLVGGELWGPAGMLLFIPITGMLELTLELWPGAQPVAGLMGSVPNEPNKKKPALGGAWASIARLWR